MRKIIRVKHKLWDEFSCSLAEGPCVQPAFSSADCFCIVADNTVETLASMIWYSAVFRNNCLRGQIITDIPTTNGQLQMDFLNKNIRLLARISTKPEFRGQGYASELLARTIDTLAVKYVECLTVWPDVRRLLLKHGFVFHGQTVRNNVDYWLWTKAD